MKIGQAVLLIGTMISCSGKVPYSHFNPDENYERASKLLTTFDPDKSNVSEILTNLDLSAKLGNSAALTKLGEFWLLGFPQSRSNPFYMPYESNLALAQDYFEKADGKGDPDAYFYLKFMQDQSRILENFTGPSKLPRSKDSFLQNAHLLLNYQECMSSSNKENCGTCDAILPKAIILAIDSLNYLEYRAELLLKIDEYYAICPYELVDNSQLALSELPDTKSEKTLPEVSIYYKSSTGQFKDISDLNLLKHPENYPDLMSSIEKAANNGNRKAMNLIGNLYLKGENKNPELGLDYLSKAAETGDGKSAYELGEAYFQGIGTKTDFQLALNYLQSAANRKQIKAKYMLGNYYFLRKNCNLALKWYLQIIKIGKFNSYLENAFAFYQSGDLERAYLNYAFAADLGMENGQARASFLIDKLKYKLKISQFEAVSHYYQQAVLVHQSGYAHLKLGEIAFYGTYGQTVDYSEAYQHFKKASRYPKAVFCVAYMHQLGVGASKNLKVAHELYKTIEFKSACHLFDEHAFYPAKIALFGLYVQEIFSGMPLVSGFIDYLLEFLK